MDKRLLRMFLIQLQFQGHIVTASWHGVEESLAVPNTLATFGHLQNLLNAAANIKKVAWENKLKPTFVEERSELRRTIGLRDDSVLKNVKARNHFEHFDERIGNWWKTSKEHRFVELSIGPIGELEAIADEDRFRYFDTKTADLYTWGERYHIPTIVDEVKALALTIDSALGSTWL